MIKISTELHERIEKLISAMGYELFGYELITQGRSVTFRLYIEVKSPGEQKNVGVDDCSLVSRQVSALLDVEDPIQGRYQLEVSTPGINRPLFDLKHYQRYVGSHVKIRLHSPVNQRRQFKGLLKRVEGDDIHIIMDDSLEEVVLPFSAVEKANLIGELSW